MATREAWLPGQHLLNYLQHTIQWTIYFSSRNYNMTLQKTAHLDSFKICCQVEDSMLSWTTTAADGETRKTACPKGSILFPILFNIYTNDQPLHDGTRNFLYADDLCVTAQYPSFTEVEHMIEEQGMNWQLTIDPTVWGPTLIRPKLRCSTWRTERQRTLEVKWNNTDLENTPHPKYLGVTLDRTLSYKKHIHNTKIKVATRNNILKKLSNSRWGCNAYTIRTTALALSYSTNEYTCPIWARSPHTSKLDTELNDTCRSITGCVSPTNVEELYRLAGIAPPDIRRDVCGRVEKKKQETNVALSLHDQAPTERGLKREILSHGNILWRINEMCIWKMWIVWILVVCETRISRFFRKDCYVSFTILYNLDMWIWFQYCDSQSSNILPFDNMDSSMNLALSMISPKIDKLIWTLKVLNTIILAICVRLCSSSCWNKHIV